MICTRRGGVAGVGGRRHRDVDVDLFVAEHFELRRSVRAVTRFADPNAVEPARNVGVFDDSRPVGQRARHGWAEKEDARVLYDRLPLGVNDLDLDDPGRIARLRARRKRPGEHQRRTEQ